MTMTTNQTVRRRRDEVRAGDVIQSSHGYRLLVSTVRNLAQAECENPSIYIGGYLHGVASDDPRMFRSEVYPANVSVAVEVRRESGSLAAACPKCEWDNGGTVAA